MKRLLLTTLLLITPLLADAGFDERLTGRKLPGQGVKNQCEPYSKALLFALWDRGYEARRLVYYWRSEGKSGYHAVVLVRHKGKLFLHDNEHSEPRRVYGNTDLEVCRNFCPSTRTIHCPITLKLLTPKSLDTLFYLPKPIIP